MSLIIKRCIECPFSKAYSSNLDKVWCEVEKKYVELDMSDCKIFEPKDFSQYSQHCLYRGNIDFENLEITTELTAKNIANIFIKNRINPRMLSIDLTYNMVEIDLLIDPKDIFLLDKASKEVAKILGVECMIRPRLAPMHVFDYTSHNQDNYKRLCEEWSEKRKCETFFYKSRLEADKMIKVADLLHAIQNSYCLGVYCEDFDKDKHCQFFDSGFCYKKGDRKIK